MSAEKMLTSVTQSRAPATMYGYPAAALVAELGNGANYIHIIYGSGDAGDTPGSLYDNAPNGSLYIPLTATAGNKKLYVKFGAKGLIDGTWQSESAAAYVPYTGATANVDIGTFRFLGLKFTGRRDNGPSLAVSGPSAAASASAGADVSNYEGIFYNATFNDATNAGTKKNRCIIGGNLDVDMEIQGPHMVRITAADNTVVDGDPDAAVGNGLGIVQVLSQSKMEFCPWTGGSAPHAATAQYLILTSKNETVFTVGTGTYNGGDIVLKTNTGLLYVNGEALAYSGKLSQASTNAPTVAGAKNNTGQTATFAYVSGGTYTLTFGAAIAADADHIQVQITNALTSGIGLITAYASSSSVIQIRSLDVASGSLDNGLMAGASIRVTVTE